KNKKIIIFGMVLLFAIIFLSGIASAEENMTLKEQAEACLGDSEKIMGELIEAGFNINRVNDTLEVASVLYTGQSSKLRVKDSDFSFVLTYCQEIKDIRETAYIARDEFSALLRFYGEVFEENVSVIYEMIAEIENEFESERYEKVSPLIEKTYEKISQVQAEQTALRAFYEGTTKGLKRFFERNWISVLIFMGVAFILFLIYRKTALVWIINRKIQGLELRKEKILDIIRDAQREYFQDGKMSEGIFNIKTKTLAELIRDIDRQIPMLRERLAELGKLGNFSSTKNVERKKTGSFQPFSENVKRKQNRKFFSHFNSKLKRKKIKIKFSFISFFKKLKRKKNNTLRNGIKKKFSFTNLFKKLRGKLK
ncbi:MAG: hypothetical protein Q8O84_05485, partial [Nanoarchaeota archaeon]|nr:hypothetical protein [Nanoarchaeota archaeon]